MDPPYSSFFKPLRGGFLHMTHGIPTIGTLMNHFPLKYVDLEPGDMLFNPPWEWHAIQNYPGLSIGVPIREANYMLSFSNNFQYSSIVLVNLILKRFGVEVKTY